MWEELLECFTQGVKTPRHPQAQWRSALILTFSTEYGMNSGIYLVLCTFQHTLRTFWGTASCGGAKVTFAQRCSSAQRWDWAPALTAVWKRGGKVFFKVNIPGTFTHQTETDVNTKTALPIISDARCGCYWQMKKSTRKKNIPKVRKEGKHE